MSKSSSTTTPLTVDASSANTISTVPTAANGGAGVPTFDAYTENLAALERARKFLEQTSTPDKLHAAIAEAARKAGDSTATAESVRISLADPLYAKVDKALHETPFKYMGTSEANMTHFKLFRAFVDTDDDASCAIKIAEAIRDGADAKASILNVENLLAAANKDYEAFKVGIVRHKKTLEDFTTALARRTSIIKKTGETEQDFYERMVKFWSDGTTTGTQAQQEEWANENSAFVKIFAVYNTRRPEFAKPCADDHGFVSIIKDLYKAYTAMHIAAREGLILTMEALYDNGADIKAKALEVNKEQYEAIPWTNKDKVPTYNEILLCLMKGETEAIDPKLLVTPMLAASDTNQVLAMEWLLDHGAHLDKRTAAHYKKQSGNSSDLLNWLEMHAAIAGDPHHDIFIEAIENLGGGTSLTGSVSFAASSAAE